ncbi:MAG: PIN domain-containing protein [Rhodoferax sp.]|uniref:PIN domain-containing protein n=1 Tax=Rhodoferax sp. TaxID=50421 RepID=UPI00326666CE
MTDASTAPLWLLDTNILSNLLKQPQGPLAHKIAALVAQQPGQVVTSVVVECELNFGARRIASSLLEQKIAALLAHIPPLPLEREAANHYASVRTQLQQQGQMIGPNDLLIAAHALALGCTVVTDNEAEFRRVPGLPVENWLRPGMG